MHVNAYTTEFVTVFHIETPTSYLSQAIESLVQIVFNPLLRPQDITNERKVVLNELTQKTNNPQSLASLKTLEILFPPNNPLHFPVIGLPNTLQNISHNDISQYYLSHYTPQNSIFFTKSSLSKNTIKNTWLNAYKKFTYIPPSLSPTSTYTLHNLHNQLLLTSPPKKINISNKFPNNQTYFVLFSYLLPPLTIKEIAALKIFKNYLAGSLSSILFLELREKHQLIYSVSTRMETTNTQTVFQIFFNCKKNNNILNKSIQLTKTIIKNIIKNSAPIEEFNKFKNKTIILDEEDKSSGDTLISNIIKKTLFNLNYDNFQTHLKSITNSYLHNILKNKFPSKNFITIT